MQHPGLTVKIVHAWFAQLFAHWDKDAPEPAAPHPLPSEELFRLLLDSPIASARERFACICAWLGSGEGLTPANRYELRQSAADRELRHGDLHPDYVTEQLNRWPSDDRPPVEDSQLPARPAPLGVHDTEGQPVEPYPVARKVVLPRFSIEGLTGLYESFPADSSHGAPLSLRILIAAMAHLPIAQRDGRLWELRFTTDDVIGWLWPGGWRNKAKRFHRLAGAFDQLAKLAAMDVEGLGRLHLVTVQVRPITAQDQAVVLTVRLPHGAAHGPAVDWPTLCELGQRSNREYRAYLMGLTMMHQAAHRGRPLTRLIGALELDAKGSPRRRRDGRLLRSKTELVGNEMAELVREWSSRDLAQALGMNSDSRVMRARAVEAFRNLARLGLIDLEEIPDPKNRQRTVFRVFGVRPAPGSRPQ